MLTPIKPVKTCECSGSCGDCCCCTKESIGLGNVDNTSDLNKPLSTDMVNALSGKVGLDIFTQLKNRVLALEAKDGNNVKLSGVNVQTIQGTLKANDPANSATDKTLVTANWVSQTGAEAPNNLVHRSGTETMNGTKSVNALKFVGVVAKETANTDYLLLKHSLTSTTQDYRCILQICKTNPVICQLIYLDYKITDDKIVTLTNSRQTTLSDYGSTNTSTYSIYIENNAVCIAIRTSENQGVVCNVLANWVGSRFGLISDVSEQGNTVVIPTQHAEVII